jgi:hypothetical protein
MQTNGIKNIYIVLKLKIFNAIQGLKKLNETKLTVEVLFKKTNQLNRHRSLLDSNRLQQVDQHCPIAA